MLLAALQVEEVWQADRAAEAEAVYGTTRGEHPGLAHLLEQTHPSVSTMRSDACIDKATG